MLYDILLDIGGTGIKGGFFSVDKNIISKAYDFISNSEKEKDVIIRHFSSICSQIWDQIADDDKKIRNIRMAFPGPFDYEKGISKVKGLAKYENLFEISVPNEMISLGIKENYSFIPKNDMDFKFINDVKAYALGVMDKRKLYQGYKVKNEEHILHHPDLSAHQGAQMGVKVKNKNHILHHPDLSACQGTQMGVRVIYLCIGTGSGSAYSIDGKISIDHSQGIPENGWIYPIPFKDSVIDEYISVRGINKLAWRYCNKSLSPLELSIMARNGNDNAIKAYKEFGDNLNSALLPLLKKFGASTFVIGGNISHSSEMFLSPIKESCRELGIEIIIESDTSKLVMIGLTKL